MATQEFTEYYPQDNEDSAPVKAYKAENDHTVIGRTGEQSVSRGQYVIQTTRPDMYDVVDGTWFEDTHATRQPDVTTDRDEDANDTDGEYNPADHTVADVNRYLSSASPDERDRVLAAERNGANRAGVKGT